MIKANKALWAYHQIESMQVVRVQFHDRSKAGTFDYVAPKSMPIDPLDVVAVPVRASDVQDNLDNISVARVITVKPLTLDYLEPLDWTLRSVISLVPFKEYNQFRGDLENVSKRLPR